MAEPFHHFKNNNNKMIANSNSIDVEEQQSPSRRRGGGLDNALGGEAATVNFSQYLNAQRQLSSQRFLQRRASVRSIRVPTTVSEDNEATNNDDNNDRKVVTNPSSSRRLARLSTSDWDDIFEELGEIDENGQFHDAHAHMKPFYAPPIQRQRWGEDQVLPHVNWGDLFFDLFYVGMAYNLGVMVKSSMNDQDWLRGIIYFVGIFGTLWTSWEVSMQYESRYMTIDYSHRLIEVIRFLFISTAILHITPMEFMADSTSSECLAFTWAVFLESLVHLFLSCELYMKAKGDKESIKNHTIDNVCFRLLPMSVICFVAAIISTVLYVQPNESSSTKKGYSRLLASPEQPYDYGSTTPVWQISDLSLTLLAGYYVFSFLVAALTGLRKHKTTDIRKRFVPSNIEFEIHRYGEWILLMIGEGILSLLIVLTTETKDYYIISTFGVLTMIFIQVLTFESQPHHPEGHALWRNFLNAMCFSLIQQVLSMALIIFGLSYKVFLNDALKEGVGYGEEKFRVLAAASDIDTSVASSFYAVSLFVVILSLQFIPLTHSGIKEAARKLLRGDGSNKLYWPVVTTTVLNLGLSLFALTLMVWTEEPDVLTLCGFGVVLSLTVTRVLDFFFIYQKGLIEEAATRVTERFRASVVPPRPNSTSTDSPQSRRVTALGDDLPSGIDSNSFDGIIVADLNGIISSVNETARILFGYETKQELIGKNLSVLCGGSDGKRHDGYVKAFKKRVIDEPSSIASNKVLGRQRMLHACRADGSEFPCVIGIKLVSNNKMIAGYIRDMSGVVLTEKKRVSIAMNVDSAMDKVVCDHAYDAIIATNRDGKILRVNEVAVKEFGYEKKSDLIGVHLALLMHGARDHPDYLLDSHGKQRVIVITRKDGTEMQCIVATRNIKGTPMVASYIRNLHPVKSSIMEVNSKED